LPAAKIRVAGQSPKSMCKAQGTRLKAQENPMSKTQCPK